MTLPSVVQQTPIIPYRPRGGELSGARPGPGQLNRGAAGRAGEWSGAGPGVYPS